MPVAIDTIRCLATSQASIGVRGSVVEIGVHHGRLFLLLHLLAADDEWSVAYDLFDSQDENVDGSGSGNRLAFEDNLRRHGRASERVRIRAVNSMRLTVDQVLADGGGPARLFSVDGGHTAGITANDMALAERSLCEGGLLVLDDFFNEAWPGVAEGACRYLFGVTALVPVAMSGNKLIFTKGDRQADDYRRQLGALAGMHESRDQVFLDRPVTVIAASSRTPLRRALAATKLWQFLRTTGLGRIVRRL